MKARYYLLGCLALAACNVRKTHVVINFAQPFPTKSTDLNGFLRRDRRHYAVPGDSGRGMIIEEKMLLASHLESGKVAGTFLDSMGIPRRSGRSWGRHGRHYEVQALAADSFRLRVEAYDTLLSLSGPRAPRLRHHRGWYYLSSPATEDSTKWEVQRLGIIEGRVVREVVNPDSLRILALDPAIVQRRHYKGTLILTLTPQSRQDIKQIGSYNGLWLGAEEYVANALTSK